MSGLGTVETRELLTFVKKKHELDKLLKLLEKSSPDAVKLLTDTIADVKIDLKIRIACARDILNMHQATAGIINADEMARLIAEYKIGDGATKRLTAVPETGKPSKPKLEFDYIREVGED